MHICLNKYNAHYKILMNANAYQSCITYSKPILRIYRHRAYHMRTTQSFEFRHTSQGVCKGLVGFHLITWLHLSKMAFHEHN